MKKILDGFRFDTEKATKIGSANNISNSLTYWSATLYRTPYIKQHFLAGKGGPMTRFGQSNGRNSWGFGEDIIPMEREDALEWAKVYLSEGVVDAFFNHHNLPRRRPL